MSSVEIADTDNDVRVLILELTEEYSFKEMLQVNKATLQYRRFDGELSHEITRIDIERGDSVAVLLYDPDNDIVVLTRQFRYPVYAKITSDHGEGENTKRSWILEMVAGSIEPGTEVKEAARKEIIEEAGYLLQGDLRQIATIYPSPGWTSERIHIFLGLVNHKDQVSTGGGLVAEGEDIRVEHIPFQEAMEMISYGEICDAKTIIALQHLALLKSREEQI